MEGVHGALRDCFNITPDNRVVRLTVREPQHFQCPPHCAQPEYFTYITIDCFPGRTLKAKRCLYRTAVANLERCGIPANHIKIMIREIATENWGIDGGQAACDIKLDSNVNH